MAGYWPRSLFTFLWTSTSSRSIKTQKENSANIQASWPRAWSIIYTYWACFQPPSWYLLRSPLSSLFAACPLWAILGWRLQGPTLGMASRHHVQRYCSFRVLFTHALIISYHMQGKNIRLGATTYNAFFRDRFFNLQVRFSSLMRTWLTCLLLICFVALYLSLKFL